MDYDQFTEEDWKREFEYLLEDNTKELIRQEVAKQICGICENLFPVSWRALCQS